jgi:hypothetical protein
MYTANDAMSELLPIELDNPKPGITWRSVLLGIIGTVLICGLTPYNDYALNNTYLVGNNLPLGVVMGLFLFVVIVNGPLSRWWSRHAFSSGELTVAMAMTMISCALPSGGLMRYFPASIIMPFYHAQSNAEYLSLLERLQLPTWLLPSFNGDTPRQWMHDPIVRGFAYRWRADEPVPYWAWVVPAITWGIFLFSMYGALICLVTLVRRQWVDNERLPFPLAQIQIALVEQPRAGRWLNESLARRSFWIGFCCVFLLRMWNGSHEYWPQYVVEIPLKYNLHDLFAEPPWKYMDWKIKESEIFFTAIGVSYFLSGSVAFSLWMFFLLHQLYRIGLGTIANDPEPYGQGDQHFGGIAAFTLMILWMGRNHWKLILAQAMRGHRPGEPRGRYLSYPFAFWSLVGCTLIMIGWLVAAGASLGGAVILVLLLLTLFMVITRIIAETGLMHGQLQIGLTRTWQILSIEGWTHPVLLKTFFYGAMLNSVHYDFREVVPVYASHGLKVADATVFPRETINQDSDQDRRTGRKLIVLMILSLFVGYVVSYSSMLWTEYRYEWTQDSEAKSPINVWGAADNPRLQVLDPTIQYEKDNYNPKHDPTAHFAFGFLFTGFLSFMRMQYSGWPLHPIGFLMLDTFPIAYLWLSIFIGWMAKALILRFGGTNLYVSAKPLFLGLIVGESIAAGTWLIAGILLSSMGLPYHRINIMPD